MTNVSKGLRRRLEESWTIRPPRIHTAKTSRDGTVKFLLRLEDDSLIESVLIPEKEKMTQCLSSQVGCPMGCTFCSTGKMGFVRNMRAGEIAGQVLAARNYMQKHLPEKRLTNFVFMGMGDPLLNWEEMKKALTIFHHPLGLDISRRRITVSTVGFPGLISGLGKSDSALLAVSLHAPTQELRRELMPRAAGFELRDLLQELKRFPLRPRERVTIEYLLIQDKNDSPEHARLLAKILDGLKCKVNLIAYNPAGDSDHFQRPNKDRVLTFEKILWSKGLTATLRKSKGLDINAACGQLKAETPPGA